MKKKAHTTTTGELEFQGAVVTWMNEDAKRRVGLGIDIVTQEPHKGDRKRNDLVVWKDRSAHQALATLELKTPATPITDPVFLLDACRKAQNFGAPVFAVWNMQAAELYRTPPVGTDATPIDRIKVYPLLTEIRDVEDWLDADGRRVLQKRALEILDDSWENATSSASLEFPLESSVFVERLLQRVAELRRAIAPALARAAVADRKIRQRMTQIATQQGFAGFVDDLNEAMAGQFAYRLIGQVLFYFALRRKQPSLKELLPAAGSPLLVALRPFWDDVRRFDYEALFAPVELDTLIPLPPAADLIVREVISEWARYDWHTLRDDVLGAIFEKLLPVREQILLGQFYTPPDVADLLVALTLDGPTPTVLDPGCGSGTFLLRSYQYLSESHGTSHTDLLNQLWGFDVSPFAAELAVINMCRQDLSEFRNFPRVLVGDFFDRAQGDKVEFPPSRKGAQQKVLLPIPKFDAILANPPYIRSQQQDDLDPKYKERLQAVVVKHFGFQPPPKSDLFTYFGYHAWSFLKEGGRLGFVTSASWLTSEYGSRFQQFLLEEMRLIAVVGSEAESFFSQVEQNTVLFVAAKRKMNERPKPDEVVKFVTLKQRLGTLLPAGPTRTAALRRLADAIDAAESPSETSAMRIVTQQLVGEALQLRRAPGKALPWARYMRAPATFAQVFELPDSPVTSLESLAECRLGYKSLQNKFFYVSPAVVKKFHIEARFLRPILKLADLDGGSYIQDAESPQSIFFCNEPESKLKGTGALQYIRAMEGVPATEKRQAQKVQTIRSALESQGGKYWYSPKAQPHDAHMWVRKAIDSTHAPFLFANAVTVDQRCNMVVPITGVEWKELGALLTSSVFVLGLEAAGAASLGAGALEVATRRLGTTRVLDLRLVTATQRLALVRRAEAVWLQGKPPVWSMRTTTPDAALRNLDRCVLELMGSPLDLDDLYESLHTAVTLRTGMSKGRQVVQKASEDADVQKVAQAIAGSVAHLVEARRFPEDFAPAGSDEANKSQVTLPETGVLAVEREPLFGTCRVIIHERGENPLLDASLPAPVAEVLVRALLMGRRAFTYPTVEAEAGDTLDRFLRWVRPIVDEIEGECTSSTLGTRYADQVRGEVLRRLGIASEALLAELPLAMEIEPL
jgi:methylase of polypeptide subunit release factors